MPERLHLCPLHRDSDGAVVRGASTVAARHDGCDYWRAAASAKRCWSIGMRPVGTEASKRASSASKRAIIGRAVRPAAATTLEARPGP